MNVYEIYVKSTTGTIAVKIFSHKVISEYVLDELRNMELDTARKYCEKILLAKLIVK